MLKNVSCAYTLKLNYGNDSLAITVVQTVCSDKLMQIGKPLEHQQKKLSDNDKTQTVIHLTRERHLG